MPDWTKGGPDGPDVDQTYGTQIKWTTYAQINWTFHSQREFMRMNSRNISPSNSQPEVCTSTLGYIQMWLILLPAQSSILVSS